MMNETTAKFLLIALTIGAFLTMTLKAQAQSDKLPAPDFSEMGKYYEIVKWTYSDAGNIKMIIKPKSAPPQIHHIFTLRFFDEDGIDLQYKYNICCPGYNSPAGEAERVETPAPEESKLNKVKSIIAYRILDDGTLVGPKPSESQKKSTAAPDASSRQNGEMTDAVSGQENAQSSADCDFTAAPSAVRSSEPFSAALAKSALFERYGFEKDTGGLSSPSAIGITFENVSLLGSYTNTVNGAQRKHDGAPAGATVYRFHAKYIVCRKYSDSTRRTQYESDNVCFKDKNGSWNCPVDSVPQITELK